MSVQQPAVELLVDGRAEKTLQKLNHHRGGNSDGCVKEGRFPETFSGEKSIFSERLCYTV